MFGDDKPSTFGTVLPINQRRYVDSKFEEPLALHPLKRGARHSQDYQNYGEISHISSSSQPSLNAGGVVAGRSYHVAQNFQPDNRDRK